MRWMFEKTAVWLWITALSAAVAFAAGQADLPAGEGKRVLEADCVRCHTLERVVDKKWDKDTWQAVVEGMRDNKRAEITDEDLVIVVDYLTKHFGTESTAAPAGSSANPADADTEKLVAESCTSCHGMDLISTQRLAKADWETVIKGMTAMGAPLNDQQITVVADYLARHYGPEQK